jgi:hypothetical protein
MGAQINRNQLVSHLASQMANREYADWTIIDGPGRDA